ncbi:MAG: OmpA family protein [Woeseiaceae bacterium]|nr:OmpA family protein [Woeseiaceae bacterium]
MRNHKPQTLLVATLLTSGVLASATVGHGTNDQGFSAADRSALDDPAFQVWYRPGRLSIEGSSTSPGHEDGLQQLVDYQFGRADVESRMSAAVLMPDYWETASMLLLHTVAATDAARAEMTDAGIDIVGVTSDPHMLRTRLKFLRENVAPGMQIREEIMVLGTSGSLGALCQRNLTSVAAQPVAFHQSSAELRTSSFAILDRIIGLTRDCRDRKLAITGHTDMSGNEARNRQLSLARAQSVADYLVRNGVPASQLIVAGVGSSDPAADNATAYGRGLNRRIEFELR